MLAMASARKDATTPTQLTDAVTCAVSASLRSSDVTVLAIDDYTILLRRQIQTPADCPITTAMMLRTSKSVKGDAIRKNAP